MLCPALGDARQAWSTDDMLDFIAESGLGLGLEVDGLLNSDTLCLLFRLLLRLMRTDRGGLGVMAYLAADGL